MITEATCDRAEKAMAETSRAIGRLSYIAANYEEGHPIRMDAEKDIRNKANLALQSLLELIRDDR